MTKIHKRTKKPVPVVLAMVLWCCIALSGCKDNRLPSPEYQRKLESKAKTAQSVIKNNGLNTKYILFIDYSIPSGTPRLFVWSVAENKVIAQSHVMHGPGKGSTAEKPVFSNETGSNCSSLGKFIVTKEHGTKITHSYRLKGLDKTNSNAYSRGIMIHRSTWVDNHKSFDYIPLHPKSCLGCVTVSTKGMKYLDKLIGSQSKRLLLWSFQSNN